MSDDTTKLLPCPFCGDAFLMGQEPHDNHPIASKFYLFHDYGPLGSAARKCIIDVPRHFDTKEDAIAAWNRRTAAVGAGLVERLNKRANQIGQVLSDPPHDRPDAALMHEAASALSSLQEQVEALTRERDEARARLFPYADDKQISGMSWNGFYLIGNDKSIKELRRIENDAAQIEVYRTAFDERIAAAEAEVTRLRAALHKEASA